MKLTGLFDSTSLLLSERIGDFVNSESRGKMEATSPELDQSMILVYL